MLTVTAASGSAVDAASLVARIASARKIDAHQVETAISELAEAGLVLDQSAFGLSEVRPGRYDEIRAAVDGVTARLFGDFRPRISPPQAAFWPSSPPGPTPNSPASALIYRWL